MRRPGGSPTARTSAITPSSGDDDDDDDDDNDDGNDDDDGGGDGDGDDANDGDDDDGDGDGDGNDDDYDDDDDDDNDDVDDNTPRFLIFFAQKIPRLPAFGILIYASKLRHFEIFSQSCWGKLKKRPNLCFLATFTQLHQFWVPLLCF